MAALVGNGMPQPVADLPTDLAPAAALSGVPCLAHPFACGIESPDLNHTLRSNTSKRRGDHLNAT